MSLTLDIATIRERFIAEWDDEAVQTIHANEGVDPDETKPYVRFIINPGAKRLIARPSVYSQLGRVWLQILVPAGNGDADAYELADKFIAVFHEWRSEDGCLRTNEGDTTTIPNGQNEMFQVNVSIPFESIRSL